MPGLFPNPSAAPEAFKPGDQVKWYVNGKDISPYVGTVSEIVPAIHKVWVEWPVGGNQQHSPEDLIKIPPFVGVSTAEGESGYSSYDKAVSQADYGTMDQPTVIKLAKKIAAGEEGLTPEEFEIKKLASGVASKFASNVVDKIAVDVYSCIEKNMTDIQTYQAIYPQFKNACSDDFLRSAIEKIYSHCKKSE